MNSATAHKLYAHEHFRRYIRTALIAAALTGAQTAMTIKPQILVRLTIPTGETDSTPPPGSLIDREASVTDEEPSYRMTRAINLLVRALADGPKPVAGLRRLAASIRLCRSDLRAARAELGARSFAGEDGQQYWELRNF